MLVPDNQQQQRKSNHVISMYLATCGANGHLLGSDEKEIIYLVFGIIDIQNKEIIGIKQYLVRPVGLQCNNNNNNNAKSTATSPNTSATSSESGSIASTSYIEPLIPEAIIQSAGRSLHDVINDFDSYLRSLKIDQNSLCLVTDGQLPLRQCLHPESSAKDIPLPSYYWKFSDLKKEYVQTKQPDQRALIPIADVLKLPNMPAPSTTASISTALSDILSEMGLQPYADNDFYIKESRDMITIVQSMIIAGHTFVPNEVVNQTLEPGICSIDDDIDGNCIVRARGLPWQSSDQDIAKFFRGLNVAKGGVALCLSAQGRRNGEALIRFISQEHRDMALKRHKHHIGSRYIEVYRASGEDFLAVAGGASNEAQAFLSKGAQVIIRMRGLPYDCTAAQVLEFFANGEKSCKVMDDAEGILFVKKPDGRSTGDAFVLFADESDSPKALSKHRESIGQRYIELFRSTIAEVQQVLNRSMDPKTYEQNAPKPPLIAQIPPTIAQMPMLPQHVITSGIEKNCIRLRGLPYEAKVEHILHFLEDFAKHIVYQGVHLVYNSQGQFNGEAFIQMDSESAAQASAQQKHHKHMMFGKKQRYIEVFQCSGDDMNLVLQGGYQQFPSPPAISAKPLPSGNSMLTPTFAPFNQFIPSPPIYSSPPHIIYWTGYGPPHHNGPLSPTYIQPLPIPPHAFHHFSPDRPPALFPEMEVEMQAVPAPQQIQQQSPQVPIKSPPPESPVLQQQQPLPSQVKVTTNFNFQYDDNGNLGRVDVSKALCYQSQEVANNVVTKKVLVMHQKKKPILISSPNGEQPQEQLSPTQQHPPTHYVDCNNNLNPQQITHAPPPLPTVIEAQLPPQPIFAPKTVNFIQPPFINHLNWNHPQFQ